jgi:hypothetical protein
MKLFALSPIALGLFLWFLARGAYSHFTAGVPDSGMLPIVAVPLAFALYSSGPLNIWPSLDTDLIIVWTLSCSVFFLPQIAAFARTTTRRDVILFAPLTAGEWLISVWRLHSVPYSDYGYSFGSATVTIAVLLGIGAALGRFVYHTRSTSTSPCRYRP